MATKKTTIKKTTKPKKKVVKKQTPVVQTPAHTRAVFKVGNQRAYEDSEIDIFNENMENYFNNLNGEPPTINGLALGLGFVDKWSLYEYQERPVFTASIKQARTMIEKHHESRMSGTQQVAGSIFVLKNLAGWKEQTEQTVITKEYKIEI